MDWEILRNSSVSLYLNRQYLEEDVQWFRENHYRVYAFDCTTWFSRDSMHSDFQSTLSFPGYYGRNLDALWDCLSAMSIPDEGGALLVLDGFNGYAKNCGAVPTHSGKPEAEVILDILASASRYFSLTGKRFITLVQSDDPWMRFERLGGASTQWNRREWLNKNRGV
jgi:hypothetical protein